jgi:L-threonylcarbamoyladenylate synthase
VQRLFQIKGRSVLNPVLVLIDRMAMLEQVALPVGAMAHALMHAFWPGQVTFVVRAVAGLPSGLTAGSGKIGVRWTAHPVASALVDAVGAPLTGTSANISGGAGCAAIAMLDPIVQMAADLVLDAGGLAGGPGSTVVDVTDGIPVILREGAVAAERIMACFERFLMERGSCG